MNTEKQVEYWLVTAQHDLSVADSLYNSGKYDWCLYIGHLVIEKTLKALYVKRLKTLPPKTHLLHVLVEPLNLNLSEEQSELLRKINEFNIEARYPDVKLSFYKICTEEFATNYFNKIKELQSWLLMKL